LFLLAHATVQMKTSVIHPVLRDRYRMLSKRSRCECYQAVKTQSSARCVAPEHLRRAFLASSRRFVFGQVAHATAGAPKMLSQPASATISGAPAWIRTAFLTNSAKSMMRLTPWKPLARRAPSPLFLRS
jgi:hypothetical protein